MKITFLSTYKPRKCGLATFTQNLVEAIISKQNGEKITRQVVAIDENHREIYPDEVKYVVDQHSLEDYREVAKKINQDGTDICILQHEFGIFGGDSGLYILSFAHALKIPLIVILHTVLKHPDFLERSIIQALGKKAQKLVVMSRMGAGFLEKIYGIPSLKIEVIEHGVPDAEDLDIPIIKERLGLNQQKILFTFGLLSRNKGIETVIQALPKVVKNHPEVLYMVLGKTHPNVFREFGDRYRKYLHQLVEKNNLEQHVFFLNKFVSEKTLFEYLSATDIYITPYLNEAQITSGTLSYAIGAGAAVVSTPYWHAQEQLAEGRGCLFDFNDPDELADILIDLLDHPEKLSTLKHKAFEYGKEFRWGKIGLRYYNLLKNTLQKYPQEIVPTGTDKSLSLLPALKFDHLHRLTDDTGIIQHAKFGVPNFKEGYCLDDNARALLAALMAYNQVGYQEALNLIPIYFSYIHYMQNIKGTFRNFLSFNRQFLDEEGSEDAFGRTIWALGYLIKHAPNNAYYQLAEEIFFKASENFVKLRYNRGLANTIIGLSYYLQKNPGSERVGHLLDHMTNILVERFEVHREDQWHWFEDQLSYDNGILPLALFHSVQITRDKKVRQVAEESTQFLHQCTMKKGYLAPVGSNGWHLKHFKAAQFAQQATDVMAMVLLYYRAYLITRKEEYLQEMFISYRWFLGENDLQIPLYDFETHGCCDGLEANGINRNQGAESTLAYLISHLTIHETTTQRKSMTTYQATPSPEELEPVEV